MEQMHLLARDGGWVTGATLVNLAGVNLRCNEWFGKYEFIVECALAISNTR